MHCIDDDCMYVIKYEKKEWHTATKPLVVVYAHKMGFSIWNGQGKI